MLSIGTPLYTRFSFKTRGGFGSLYETSNALVFATAQSKVQLISEYLFDFVNFPKNQQNIWQISALESKKWSNHKIKAHYNDFI